MNEFCRTRVVHAPPPDEPRYCSVLDRDPRWIAASTQVTPSPLVSRLSVTTALLLVGAAFIGGLSVGGSLALTFGAEARPRRGKPEVWMFPYPAIGGPARPGEPLSPPAGSLESIPEGIESLSEPVADVTTPQPGARLRGESR